MQNIEVEEDVIKIENLLLAIRIPSGFKSVDFVQKMELKFVDFDNFKEALSKLYFGVSKKISFEFEGQNLSQ